MMVNRSRVWLLLISALVLLLPAVLPLAAQEAPIGLSPNAPVEGSFGDGNAFDVYALTVTDAGAYSFKVESAAAELAIALLDVSGNTLGEASISAGTAAFDVADLAAGRYLVSVAGSSGSYTLSVTTESASASEPAGTGAQDVATTFEIPADVLMNSGMEVRLAWSAPVDLNLEVRDPRGNTLYFDSRTSATGGSFGFDANGLCELITETPVETATWLPGFLPGGSYEILVFYRQSCTQPATDVDFTLNVTVNGTTLPTLQARIAPPASANQDSVYVANFIVADDASGVLNEGGAYPDTAINQLPRAFADLQIGAVAVEREIPVQGAIFESQDYVSYAFEATADEVLGFSATASSGNLDTLLQIVDPNGNLIAVNDDANFSTNSSLSGVRILQTGTYLAVVTRYGKEIGGTEGEFQFVISQANASLDPELASLNLPDGDIQVYLTWNTGADLQLLVRDPVGQSVYDDTPQVNSGGLLASDGNVNCVAANGSPVSYIYWPVSLLRPGIYETEVWFQNTCNDTQPVEFTLTIVVRGQVIAVERQLPTIGDRYLISFEVQADGTAVAGAGGFISAGSSILNYQAETPLPIMPNQAVNGAITLENAFDVYGFQAQAGQVVTISMQAGAGTTLDTNLFLISPSGVQIVNNDDADPALVIGNEGRTTDSLISVFTIPADGQYLILATRFGTIYGGTVGGYQLSLQFNN
jgi:uncharacterized protein YfaP (DUF2135 family)